jgi:predicted RNase H-like HicB family nuclease
MRILANYGCKTNGESYSVTFETMGDVNNGKAETVIDELFALAKEAIQRQIEGQASGPREEPSHENHSDLPASQKQKSFIIKLAKQKGKFIKNLNALTMKEANEVIEELKEMPDKEEVNV